MERKFELGQVVCTAGVHSKMGSNDEFANFVYDSIIRYISCDWGDTCDEDKPLNDSAVANGDDRILAVYKKDGLPTIWIITEWDRSATTILFPDEY